MIDLERDLRQNAYPGRGIILGRSSDNSKSVIVYFIMGRSENSRNRVFVSDGEGIRTEAYDTSKMSDPSLVIYSPLRVLNGTTIVTNGDQTDTIYDFMAAGKTFEAALRTRTFEPDGPIFTPRISGAMENGVYKLSILKSADGDGSSVCRFFYEYSQPIAGQGHFIHTYREDGDPVPSFEGEPKTVAVGDDISAYANMIWDALSKDNKVSLFARYIDISTGEYESAIINKNKN